MDETLNEIQSKTEVNLSVVSNFLGSLQFLILRTTYRICNN